MAKRPAAGSGNPASSGSSGGVEAERAPARAGWAYDEGVEGKYTCAQCGARTLRSQFLIEATDLEGNLCVGYDREGRLEGRCYACCRGRGKDKGPKDIYADLVEDVDEETLAKQFRRLCNKRHLCRSGVNKNEHALLKIKEWKELRAKIVAKCHLARP